MKFKIFVIRDNKIEAYHRPCYAISEGEMERMLMEAVKDPNSTFAKYPEDFELYMIGLYDELSAEIDVMPKVCLGTILDIIVKTKRAAQLRERKMRGENEVSNET